MENIVKAKKGKDIVSLEDEIKEEEFLQAMKETEKRLETFDKMYNDLEAEWNTSGKFPW